MTNVFQLQNKAVSHSCPLDINVWQMWLYDTWKIDFDHIRLTNVRRMCSDSSTHSPHVWAMWSHSLPVRVICVKCSLTKPSSGFITDHSKAVFLLRIIFAICLSRLSLTYCLVCSLQPVNTCWEGPTSWPSSVWCVCSSLSYGCPRSVVVLDCIDS